MRSLYFLLLVLCVNFVFGQGKIDPTLLGFKDKQNMDYIVLFDNEAAIQTHDIKGKNNKALYTYKTLYKAAEQSQQNICSHLVSNNIYYERFHLINALRVKSDYKAMIEISKRQEVKKVLKNINISVEKIRAEDASINLREVMPEWGILKIEADSVWRLGYEGQGVTVGGQDTGYDWKVSPLKSKYRGYINDSITSHAYNWHDAIRDKSPLSADSLNPCGFNTIEPCDDNNHGTHTMGTMVGQDTSNSIGVAPKATWMACRNMERGNGQLSTYLECFEWFWAPTDSEGKNPDVTKAPHVINNSWYCSEGEGCNPDNWEPLQLAVRNLKASGIVVVVSAGNSGPNCNTVTGPPALFEPSFTIGATAINDTIASFSSRGPVSIDSSFRMKPDVSAPGRGVRSVIRGGAFASFSGTSMAGPHVAGLVALILSANKNLEGEVETIESIIRQTADPKYTDQECGGISGQALPNPIYGYGRVNALKAVELALKTTTGSAKDPSQQSNWILYPNPTPNSLTIQTSSIQSTQYYELKLKDLSGRTIQSQFFQNQTEIDLSSLPSNMYIMEIIGDKKVFISKVVKK